MAFRGLSPSPQRGCQTSALLGNHWNDSQNKIKACLSWVPHSPGSHQQRHKAESLGSVSAPGDLWGDRVIRWGPKAKQTSCMFALANLVFETRKKWMLIPSF